MNVAVLSAQPATMTETLTIFFGYAVLAIFAQNAVFTRALGVSRLVQLVGDARTNSLLFGLLQCVTQFLLAPVAWYAGGAAASLGLGPAARPLVYLGCIAAVSAVEMVLLHLIRLPWQRQLLRILPLAALNSCGYLLAVLLVTEAQNRLRSKAIPAAFRGMPITLIYIGVLALAIYGFTGHTVIL